MPEDRILHPSRPLRFPEAVLTSLWVGFLIALPIVGVLLVDPLFSAGAGIGGYLIAAGAAFLAGFLLVFSHNLPQKGLVWEERPEGLSIRKQGKAEVPVAYEEIELTEIKKELPGRSKAEPCAVLVVYRKRSGTRLAKDFRIILPVPEAEAFETRIRDRIPLSREDGAE